MEKKSNGKLAQFCIERLGTPYIMGTNGKIFTQSMYNDLTKRNPGAWFSAARLPKVKSLIGQATTDCHGLIEWFVREQSGANYDVTADMAYLASATKGPIGTIPELPGICVRYPGHIGIYIGSEYVVEARGAQYGITILRLQNRSWTHWYKHPEISYTDNALPPPAPAKVNKSTSRYSIIWLQIALNRQAALKHINVPLLEVDGIYGAKTAAAVLAYRAYKGWSLKGQPGTAIAAGTIKALSK